MPTCSPEATPAQPPISKAESPLLSMDVHVDEPLVPATTSAHEDGVLAPATVEATAPSTSTPTPNTSLTDDLRELADRPAPKKRKVAAPAIVRDSISDK
jgi:hypothetical protein